MFRRRWAVVKVQGLVDPATGVGHEQQATVFSRHFTRRGAQRAAERWAPYEFFGRVFYAHFIVMRRP